MIATAIERLDQMAAQRGLTIERDVPLGALTTLRVGGAAQRLVTPRSSDELLAVLQLARDAGVPLFVIGNGSDIVIADDGIPGLVVRNRARSITVDGERIEAASGTPMAGLVKRTVVEGLAGLEFGISIPGSLGGAVWANAGAHGGEMRDVVASVEVWDPTSGATRHLENADCEFGYRESRFKHGDEIVLSATLSLRRGDPQEIAARVAEHQAQRQATQPLADQNAGSVFRNPPGDHAGRLVDAAGLKGFRIGTAQVSTLHANFIVADRDGRSADVRAVGDHVRRVVAERFSVELQYEIEFVGSWPEVAP